MSLPIPTLPNHIGGHVICLKRGTKRPAHLRWRTHVPTVRACEQHAQQQGNFGWVIPDDIVILDLDTSQSIRAIRERYPTLQPSVITPRGRHVYVRVNPTYTFRYEHESLWGRAQCLSRGRYVVVPPAQIRGKDQRIQTYRWCKRGPWFVNDCPQQLLIDAAEARETDDTPDDDFSHDNTPEDEVRRLVFYQASDISRDLWLKTGLILFNWDKQRGLEIWREWSATPPRFGPSKFKRGECDQIWQGFRRRAQQRVTMATLRRQVSEMEHRAIRQRPTHDDQLRATHRSTFLIHRDRDALLNILLPHCGGYTLDALTDAAYNVRNDHIYLADGRVYSEKHFRVFFAGRVNHGKTDVLTWCLRNGLIRLAHGTCVLPNRPRIVNDGNDLINIYSARHIPAASLVPVLKSHPAIIRIMRHLQFLLGKARYVSIVCDMFAHFVQCPGVKKPWTLVISGPQGSGKTTLVKILRALLGKMYVKSMAAQDALSDFNEDWIVGRLVNVVDEVRIPAKDRMLIPTKLHAVISDDEAIVRGKHVRNYTTINSTNYVIFTNYRNALHLVGGERRWCVMHSPLKHVEQAIQQQFNTTSQEYFSELHQCIERYGPEIRRYFLDYRITDDFRRAIEAPKTEDYYADIRESELAITGYIHAETLLQTPTREWNNTYILSRRFFREIQNDIVEESGSIRESVDNYQRRTILRKLGYNTHIGRKSFRGEISDVYVKDSGCTMQQVVEKYKHWDSR